MKRNAALISALWLLLLVNYIDRVAMGFAGPAIMHALPMTPADFGIVLSSFGLGYALAMIPGGLLADRWGAKALLVIGPVLWAVFTGATGLAMSLGAFVVVRVCMGLSEGLSAAAIYKIIGENFDAKGRARALAISSTAIPLAPLFAGALLGTLVVAYGWQAMFFILTVPALLVALVNYFLLPARPAKVVTKGEGGDGDPTSFWAIFREPSLWVLSVAALCWNVGYWGYLGWMPSYLALARHIELASLGLIAAIPYVFALAGMIFGGWLGSSKWHRFCPQLIAIGFAGTGVSLLFAYRAEALALAIAGLAGAAFFLFGTHGPIGKVVLDLAPERRRAAYVGVFNTAGQTGGIAAPVAIGLLVSRTGTFAAGFGFMISALCIAAACFLILIRFQPAEPEGEVMA